jgi:hypothetical protein
MVSLVFIAGVMTLVKSDHFGLFLFVFTLIRVGQMLNKLALRQAAKFIFISFTQK